MSTSPRLSSHRARPSEASTSSYAPVLINRTSQPLPVPSTPSIALSYPYPLPILALLDIIYTGHYQYTHISAGGTPVHLLIAAATRILVLGLVVGCSKRWRSRGGWVAGVTGIGVGGAVWEDCKWRLGAKGEGDERHSGYLYMTILVCISEYLLFLLLLRLSPPPHRSHPLSLRLPSSAHQMAIPFQYDSEDLEYTPRSVRFRRYSSTRTCTPGRSRLFSARRGSGGGLPPDRGSGYDSAEPGPSNANDVDESVHADDEDEDEMNDSDDMVGEEESDDPYLSDSSISESSIIDLPPPLSPNRIIPPSLSMNSGLNIGRPTMSPTLGAVRRSGSARFLARSWGSMGEAFGRRMGRDQAGQSGTAGNGEEGYGTFQDGRE